MSSDLVAPYNVLLTKWVENAKPDPVRYLERQVTGILLQAIGITPELKENLVLKGGILMSLVHGSYRHTGDVDFTAIVEPHPYHELLKGIINRSLVRAAADLGYLDLRLAVQKFEYRPRPKGFETMQAPALKITIGYAVRGGPDEPHFLAGQSARALQVDISFKEVVSDSSEVVLNDTEVSIQAYTVGEIIAEKYRAMMQQVSRNRVRRQDVFDISWLLDRYNPDVEMRGQILGALLAKSSARNITPEPSSLDDPEIRRRCQAEWDDMRLEVGNLPDFEPMFEKVHSFYKGLPWGLR